MAFVCVFCEPPLVLCDTTVSNVIISIFQLQFPCQCMETVEREYLTIFSYSKETINSISDDLAQMIQNLPLICP